MYTDLIYFEGEQFSLGFDKVYKIKIRKIFSKQDLRRLNQDINIIEGSLKFNRDILENKKVHILVSPEKDRKIDFMHHRNSGLNQVLCKLAYKNNIAICINFNEILKSRSENRAILLGRIMYNIVLCRKYKVRMLLASFATYKYEMRPAKDLISFALSLGMTPKEAELALNLELFLKERKLAKGIIEI